MCADRRVMDDLRTDLDGFTTIDTQTLVRRLSLGTPSASPRPSRHPTWSASPRLPAIAIRFICPNISPPRRCSTRIAHGLYTASLISAVSARTLPGPGAVYISQTLIPRAPVKIGDTVEVVVAVAELVPKRFRARLTCACSVTRNSARRRGLGQSPIEVKRRAATATRLDEIS